MGDSPPGLASASPLDKAPICFPTYLGEPLLLFAFTLDDIR